MRIGSAISSTGRGGRAENPVKDSPNRRGDVTGRSTGIRCPGKLKMRSVKEPAEVPAPFDGHALGLRRRQDFRRKIFISSPVPPRRAFVSEGDQVDRVAGQVAAPHCLRAPSRHKFCLPVHRAQAFGYAPFDLTIPSGALKHAHKVGMNTDEALPVALGQGHFAATPFSFS